MEHSTSASVESQTSTGPTRGLDGRKVCFPEARAAKERARATHSDALQGQLPTTRFDQTSSPLSIFCPIFFRRLPGPGTPDAAVVDAFEQHGQLRGVELQSECVVRHGRHSEPAALQTLVLENEATALPNQDFHSVAVLADEGEQVATVDVLLPFVADDSCQPVNGITHVDRRRR